MQARRRRHRLERAMRGERKLAAKLVETEKSVRFVRERLAAMKFSGFILATYTDLKRHLSREQAREMLVQEEMRYIVGFMELSPAKKKVVRKILSLIPLAAKAEKKPVRKKSALAMLDMAEKSLRAQSRETRGMEVKDISALRAVIGKVRSFRESIAGADMVSVSIGDRATADFIMKNLSYLFRRFAGEKNFVLYRAAMEEFASTVKSMGAN